MNGWRKRPPNLQLSSVGWKRAALVSTGENGQALVDVLDRLHERTVQFFAFFDTKKVVKGLFPSP